MIFDIHAHVFPYSFMDSVRRGMLPGIKLSVNPNGKEVLTFDGYAHPCTPVFYDVQAQLALMDQHGVDRKAISLAPRLFLYHLPAETVNPLCIRWNDDLLQQCSDYPQRFVPVGTLPMQDTALAVKELDRLHRSGVKMIQIGTTVDGRCLDEERFFPILEAAARTGTVLLLHPLITPGDWQTPRYHLGNVAGNPYQTMAAAGCLIGSGILDRLPDLRIFLVHGGGALPYQIHRMDHAFRVRPQGTFRCAKLPSEYLRTNFWFDGLTFDADATLLLRRVAGDDRVCYGTDAPYDMTDYDQLARCESDELYRKIANENGLRLLGIQ